MGSDKSEVTLRAGIVGHDCQRIVCSGCEGVIRTCRCMAPKVTKHSLCAACKKADEVVAVGTIADDGAKGRLTVLMPELIYVSGPYGAPTKEERLANVERALDVATALWRLGHHSFVPHLSHYWDAALERAGVRPTWEQWIELDVAYLKGFDALFRIAASPGADAELWAAKGLRLKIYRSLDEVPAVAGRTW